MRHATGLFAVLAISSLASADSGGFAKSLPPKAPPPPQPATGALSERAKMLDPIQVESLTLTPIVSTQQKPDEEKLIVLDEAMGKKLVRIHEGENEDVNNLTLTNKSDQPLFLLHAQLFGFQRRLIARTFTAAGKERAVLVDDGYLFHFQFRHGAGHQRLDGGDLFLFYPLPRAHLYGNAG